MSVARSSQLKLVSDAYAVAMVDALRHGAKAWAQAVQIDEEHAFARIMEGFNAELGNPTDSPRQLPTGETH